MKRLFLTGIVIAATLLASSVAAIEINSPAPDFTASSTKGEITLSELLAKGPVILAYYYADFTSG
jgi:peroxiredoxin